MSMVYYVLEIIMAHLPLYCVYLKVIYIYIYIFGPHSVNMGEEPVSNGTSALLHFFSRTKMIEIFKENGGCKEKKRVPQMLLWKGKRQYKKWHQKKKEK